MPAGETLLRRPRLDRPDPFVAVVGGTGFGKSVLVRQWAATADLPFVLVELDRPTGVEELLAAIERSARRDGLSDVGAALAAVGPDGADLARVWRGAAATLVVDEIGRLDAAAAAALLQVAHSLVPPARLLAAGRALPPGWASTAAVVIEDELRFRRTEIVELLGSAAGLADTVADLTGGWPAAVALSAGRVGARRTSTWPDPDEVPPGVAALAELPLLSPAVARLVVGEAGLAVLADAGIPVIGRPDGWSEVAETVRDRLAPQAALEAGTRRQVALLYARGGQLAAGLRLLDAADDPEGVAELLAQLHFSALEHIGLPDLRHVVDRLTDEVLRAHPAVLRSAVRVTENAQVSPDRAGWIERGLAVFGPDSPDRSWWEAEAGRLALRRGDPDTAARWAEQAATRTGSDDSTRGRIAFVRGMAAVYRGDPGGLLDAQAPLEEAAACFRRAGDTRWEAETLLLRGFGLDYPVGAVPAAVTRIRSALDLLGQADTLRATYLTFLAEVLLFLPDSDGAAAALREAEGVAARVSDQRLQAYVQWSWAALASRQGDAGAVRERVAAVRRHADGWFDLPSGLAFLGEAAEMLAAVGEVDRARQVLKEAAGRPDAAGLDHLLARGRAVVAARFDDPGPARQALVAEADDPDVRPVDRPRLLLLAAWAAHRAGDPGGARTLVEAATTAARALPHPAALAAAEPTLAAWARSMSGEAEPVGAPRISLLGRVAVDRDRVDQTPPPGRPLELVALLAVLGPQSAESIADRFWPDVPADLGRARLRNLLNRVKSSCPDLVVRRGADLALADPVECDLADLRSAAAAVRERPEPEQAGAARQALARWTGPLCPGLDVDWLAGPDRQLRVQLVELCDLVAQTAWRSGDLDECARQLDRAARAFPDEEIRHVRLARVYVRQGRKAAARAAVTAGLDVAADLGVPPGPDLADLAERLGLIRR